MVSTLPFCGLSVCLSHSCIVLKRQKISTRFLLHTTATCLAQIALKSDLHRSTTSSTNFDSPPVNFSIVDNRRRIRRKRPSLFQMIAYTITYPLRPLLSPKWGSRTYPPGPTSRRVLPPGEYNRTYRQDFFYIPAMSPNYLGRC